jgi:hypothetical protein
LDGWAAPRQDGSDPNETLLRLVARQRGLNFPPGSQFQYNNGAYNLLASLVKRVSGQSLRAFADANIFKPLGMNQSHFHDDPTMLVPSRVSNYWKDGTQWHVGSEVPGIIGNSGLYTTTSDLLRWGQNFVDVKISSTDLLQTMQTPAVLTNGDSAAYGFGVSVGEYRGARTIEHGGGDRGIATYFLSLPDQEVTVALLCNSDTVPAQDLARRVADIYLPESLPVLTDDSTGDAVPEIPASEELARNIGWYRERANQGLLRVSIREGVVTVRDVEGDDIAFALTPIDQNQFLIVLGGAPAARLAFVLGGADRPAELHVSAPTDGAVPRVFERSSAMISPDELQEFAGSYRSEELDVTYSVVVRDSGLVMHPMGRADMPVEFVGDDLFAGSVAGTVRFVRNAEGRVTGYTMNRSLARGVLFERIG